MAAMVAIMATIAITISNSIKVNVFFIVSTFFQRVINGMFNTDVSTLSQHTSLKYSNSQGY